MDLSRFDALARQLSHSEPRRRLLGALGGTALGGLLAGGLTAETDAKKHKRKNKNKNKKKCKGCTDCQTCIKGKCQAKPEGTLCTTGTCQVGGICSCTDDPNNCPAGCRCGLTPTGGIFLCIEEDGNCEGALCETDAECGQGKTCVRTLCGGEVEVVGRCVAVCDA